MVDLIACLANELSFRTVARRALTKSIGLRHQVAMDGSTVNIHEAKTNFSKLVDAAASGETVVIAKAGRPVARLVRLDLACPAQRIDFLAGYGRVPDDFDEWGSDEVADLFEARD